MRRAVIILNIISIVSYLINVLVLAAANNTIDEDTPEGQDVREAEQALKGVAVMATFGCLFTIASLWGAVRFNYTPVALNACYMVLNFFVVGILQTKAAKEHDQINFGPLQWLINAVLIGLFLYPHVMFVLETRAGIMTKETYSTREKQSCCCV